MKVSVFKNGKAIEQHMRLSICIKYRCVCKKIKDINTIFLVNACLDCMAFEVFSIPESDIWERSIRLMNLCL